MTVIINKPLTLYNLTTTFSCDEFQYTCNFILELTHSSLGEMWPRDGLSRCLRPELTRRPMARSG